MISNRSENMALDAFRLLLQCEGRPFGGKGKRTGISDGNEGVQWNCIIDRKTDIIRVGVNLEGVKYNNRYIISDFIKNELVDPRTLSICKEIASSGQIYIRMVRDAWQATRRPPIREKFIGYADMPPGLLREAEWHDVLHEAYDCLDPETRQKRIKQEVTVITESTGEEAKRVMPVSPHLHISTIPWLQEPNDDLAARLQMANAMDFLLPVYEEVIRQSNK